MLGEDGLLYSADIKGQLIYDAAGHAASALCFATGTGVAGNNGVYGPEQPPCADCRGQCRHAQGHLELYDVTHRPPERAAGHPDLTKTRTTDP